MDAASFINALVRFSSRRPGVNKLISDNGTNFTGAKSILRTELQELQKNSSDALLAKGLEWEFIPAHTPHYGGVWERIVGLFKRMISTLDEGNTPKFDVFNTALIEMEAVLNRRPLVPLSSSADDDEALTPAHILYPATFAHSSATIIPDNPIHPAEVLRCTWKQAQSRVCTSQRLFFRDYVTLLHQRHKWTKTSDSLSVGDLILIVDETVSRRSWKMGRVIQTLGSDGLTRRVNVKRADGKISTHDRTKVVKLEMDNE